jgi:hypothetical protein
MMIMPVIKLKRDICQSRKIMMKSLMPRVSDVVQDGNLLKSIEMPLPNNSKLKKLRERLKLLQLLPLLLREVKKVKRVKVVKVKKKRKKKRRKPKHSLNQEDKTVTLSHHNSLLSQLQILKTTTLNKISLVN